MKFFKTNKYILYPLALNPFLGKNFEHNIFKQINVLIKA